LEKIITESKQNN